MKYALYYRFARHLRFRRACTIARSQKGTLYPKPIVFESLEEVKAKEQKYQSLGFETYVKGVSNG